jgi:hypothetical protein
LGRLESTIKKKIEWSHVKNAFCKKIIDTMQRCKFVARGASIGTLANLLQADWTKYCDFLLLLHQTTLLKVVFLLRQFCVGG